MPSHSFLIGSFPLYEGWSAAIPLLVGRMLYGLLLIFSYVFCQIPEGNLTGVGGVRYMLKRNLLPDGGFAVVRCSPHSSKIGVFPHPGTPSPNISLSAHFILSFPSYLYTHRSELSIWEESQGNLRGAQDTEGKADAERRRGRSSLTIAMLL